MNLPSTDGDWENDFEFENGRYENVCSVCAKTFYGHKRRLVCSRPECNVKDPDVINVYVGEFEGPAAEAVKEALAKEGPLQEKIDHEIAFSELRIDRGRYPNETSEQYLARYASIDLNNIICRFVSLGWVEADGKVRVFGAIKRTGPKGYCLLWSPPPVFAPRFIASGDGKYTLITFDVIGVQDKDPEPEPELPPMTEEEKQQAEAMCRAIENALDTMGASHNMRRDRPYDGQMHTDQGLRGATEISGITFRDLRDCYIRAYCLSAGEENPAHYAEAMKGESACLCANDIFQLKGDVDPIAVAQNMSCEIEKLMGVYPNVPEVKHIDDPE